MAFITARQRAAYRREAEKRAEPLTALRPPDWMDAAVCATRPGDLWFSEDPEDQNYALALCNSCPVRTACAQYALTQRIDYGIAGALTPKQRQNIRRSAA